MKRVCLSSILFAASTLCLGKSTLGQSTAAGTNDKTAVQATPDVNTNADTGPKPLVFTGNDAIRIQHLLQDWAGLARYRKENMRLPPPAANESRIVFYGDSITDHWGRTHGQFFPGKPYVNRGIGGQTTSQMLVRFRQDVVDLHPAAVLILAGINDIARNTGEENLGDIENNFRSMVEIAKSEHIRVIIASVLPASTLPWRPSVNPQEQVKRLNVWLEAFAQEQHLVYCNYYPSMAKADGGVRPELVYDGAVHPNDPGYAVMAPIAEEAIQKALRLPRP